MEINYNGEGKWSAESVIGRYRKLSLDVGGVGGFEPEPRTYVNYNGAKWIYNIMDSVVDGVQLGDKACIELSIDYINDCPMDPTTGYIRERMARSLKQSELLSIEQEKRLANIFICQLERGKIYKEFREYGKLFKKIGIEDYRNRIEVLQQSKKDYVSRAASKLLA